MEQILFLVLAPAVVAIFLIVQTYNGIVNRKNAVRRAWAGVLTQERQKNKILPELEKAVGQYTAFEEGLQSRITELRSQLSGLSGAGIDTKKLQDVEQLSEHVVSAIRVAVEEYPELRASDLFSGLMKEMTEQQEQVGAAIRIFNGNVESFNNYIQNFPNNVINAFLNREAAVAEFSDSEASGGFEYKPNI